MSSLVSLKAFLFFINEISTYDLSVHNPEEEAEVFNDVEWYGKNKVVVKVSHEYAGSGKLPHLQPVKIRT